MWSLFQRGAALFHQGPHVSACPARPVGRNFRTGVKFMPMRSLPGKIDANHSVAHLPMVQGIYLGWSINSGFSLSANKFVNSSGYGGRKFCRHFKKGIIIHAI
jgi:hypothetical protein